jgi:DNA-binding response OmpR family regulator
MNGRSELVHTTQNGRGQSLEIERSSKILLIDGHRATPQSLEAVLTLHGFHVYLLPNATEALQKYHAIKPDLVLLDLDLVKWNGIQVCRQLVEVAEIPLILLSSKVLDDEIVAGLEAGAVEYVTKPYSTKILVARIRAILRLSKAAALADPAGVKCYRDDYLTINLAERQLLVQGEKVKLTPTEFHLLSRLLATPGKVRTYSELLESVWGWESRNRMDYLYTYVRRLRRKLEPEAENPRYILGEHGVGYWFEPQNKDA